MIIMVKGGICYQGKYENLKQNNNIDIESQFEVKEKSEE